MPPRPKLDPQEAKEETLRYFESKSRPVVIGEVAMHLGPTWTLDEVDSMFSKLVSDGKIRCLTAEERWATGVQHGFVRCSIPK